MITVYCAFADTMKKIVGGLSKGQMIAVGIVALIALAIGFFIGGTVFLVLGVKRGKKLGVKDAMSLVKERAAAEAEGRVNAALQEKAKSEAKSAAQAAALLAAQEKLQEAERSKEEAEKAALSAERSKEEAEKNMREIEEKIRAMHEKEGAGEIVKERKQKIELLTKQEILDYASGLNEYLPASVYERGGGDLPDSCRVGICTFLLVYERKGMVKLVLRLHKKTASALESQFKLFTAAVYPKGGDWYKWILSSEVTDLDVVTAAIRMAYKYVFLGNYDEETREINDVAYANRDEMLIGEAILKYKDLPDRDFAVASDAAAGGVSYRLYGKKEMTDYGLSLQEAYPVTVAESDSPLSPNTFKVGGKTFLMAYEKDGVSKMVFRLSDEAFALLKQKHPTAEISPFPKAKGYHWYAVPIDETFSSNEDIEEIIRNSCAHVNDLNTK